MFVYRTTVWNIFHINVWCFIFSFFYFSNIARDSCNVRVVPISKWLWVAIISLLFEVTPCKTNIQFSEAATRGVLRKKVFLKISQNSQENTCARISFLVKLQAEPCNFIKKETLAKVFSCEFREIFKNTFFTELLWTTASDFS